MKKKLLLAGLVIFLIGALCVGATWAMLMSESHTLENTFTLGEIVISLEESTGTEYQMIPGVSHKKDPYVRIFADSEACWVFCKIESTADFDSYMSYEIASGWTKLEGESNIYWREARHSQEDVLFPILAEDKVTVKDTVTKQQLAHITNYPTLKFFAYAIQSEGLDNAVAAWQAISEEQEG